MRRAHNLCKRQLIQHGVSLLSVAGGIVNCRVIDFACGRGGDLLKVAGCRSYTGIDNACHALAELQRRANEMKMHVSLHLGDASELPQAPCEIALCNFALHYFCDTQFHCNALLEKIASCLVPGGVFCGTYERVPGDDFSMPWGVSHHAKIGDCVDAVEWRVPWYDVCSMALRHGMAVVCNKPLQRIVSGAGVHVWGFIFQKQRCDTQPSVLRKPDNRVRHPSAVQDFCRPSSRN